MNLLKSLGGLITEIASLDQVQDSIRNKKVIAIYYDGNDNGGKGYRTIEPVCLGYSKKGNLVLRIKKNLLIFLLLGFLKFKY